MRRAYSLSRWQRFPWTYELSIKRTDRGVASRHLIDVVRVGDRLRISHPQGSFLDPECTGPLVAIAAGIGVTPFRAMLHARVAASASAPFHLHMSARTPGALYFHDEFVKLAKNHPWFGYFPRITGSDTGWSGAQRRITARSVIDLAPTDSVFMLCAGTGMEKDLRSSLAAAGIPAERIRAERFGLSVNTVAVAGTLRVGDRSFKFQESMTLLDVLERMGCCVAAECRAGECGCCRVEIIEGRVRNIISGEREAGPVLACAVVPEGDLTVRLGDVG